MARTVSSDKGNRFLEKLSDGRLRVLSRGSSPAYRSMFVDRKSPIDSLNSSSMTCKQEKPESAGCSASERLKSSIRKRNPRAAPCAVAIHKVIESRPLLFVDGIKIGV